MDDKAISKNRTKLIRSGLGGAENTPNSQVEPTTCSSSDVAGPSNGTKRKLSSGATPPTQAAKSRKKSSPKKEVMPKGQDLVDRIWHEIESQQREKREKYAIRKAAQEAFRATSHESSAQAHDAFCFELTASNLKSLTHDDALAKKIGKEFLEHDEMVDKLLGYKMLLGRMESYTTLGYARMRDNNDDSPRARAQRDGVYGRSEAPQPPPQRRGPRTPPEEEYEEEKPVVVVVKKGPQTPPGSPGPSTPPPPPPPQPLPQHLIVQHEERYQLMVHMAQVTGASLAQVEMICGDALNRAIDNNNGCNKLEVLETFRAALTSMAAKRARSASPKRGAMMCSLSDQMELVSDATLTESDSFPPYTNQQPLPLPPPFPVLTAPPVPPTILPVVTQPPPPSMMMMSMPPPPLPLAPMLPPMSMPPPPIGHNMMHMPPPPINIPPPTTTTMMCPPPPLPQQQQQQQFVMKPRVELKSIVDVVPPQPEQLPTVRVIPKWMQSSSSAPNYPPPTLPSTCPPPPTTSVNNGVSSQNVQSTLFSALGIQAPPVSQQQKHAEANIPSHPTNIRKQYGNNVNHISNFNNNGFKNKAPEMPPPRFFF